ncbi:MAG TPA: deoxyribonuclease IV [Candidatus Dormibacteraeota bacterium]|nr:deoxyribonuclease IV [Candidatus Dormibacteraeota bacterium]
MVTIGAHVSAQGGISTAFDRALQIGAEAVQIHPTPPQTWRRLHPDEEQVATFRRRMAETGLDAFFFHAVYLINLATAKEELLAQSRGSLRHHLEMANLLGVRGVIFHPGSHRGQGFEMVLPQMAEAMRWALRETEGESLLIIENSAGSGDNIGSSFTQIRQLMAAVDDPRLRLCLDTAHAFTAGYDLRNQEGLELMVAELGQEIGFERLAAIHANDSKAPFGSNVDRHQNIGDGEIGAEPFRWMLADPQLTRAPFILEVPGLERQGPDRANVERLRELAGLPPLPSIPEV